MLTTFSSKNRSAGPDRYLVRRSNHARAVNCTTRQHLRLSIADKPIVRGDIAPWGALLVSGLAAAAGALLSLSFNWPTLCVALTVLAAGMAYNFRAKGTVWSWVPYGVFIPALPVWTFVAANAFTPMVLFSFLCVPKTYTRT